MAWGANNYGKLNVPLTATNAIAIAAGDEHSIALLDGGKVAFWGLSDFGQMDIAAYTGNICNLGWLANNVWS